jgi:hypothetical protein
MGKIQNSNGNFAGIIEDWYFKNSKTAFPDIVKEGMTSMDTKKPRAVIHGAFNKDDRITFYRRHHQINHSVSLWLHQTGLLLYQRLLLQNSPLFRQPGRELHRLFYPVCCFLL